MKIRTTVLSACHQFMRPVARFLVRCGVGYKEFAEVAKESFVEVVSQDYGIRGRKTNISRVAVLTGLTRKEVTKIRRSIETADKSVFAPKCRPEQVLEAWHRLDEYIGSDGVPIVISADGEEPSFSNLVRRVGGDIPHGAMLKELIRAGSVEECANGKLRAISRSFVPDATDPESIAIAGEAIRDLVSTITDNLFLPGDREKKLERRVYSDRLGPKEADIFRATAELKGKQLLLELDEVVAQNEAWRPGSRSRKGRIRVGLGVYTFEEKLDE